MVECTFPEHYSCSQQGEGRSPYVLCLTNNIVTIEFEKARSRINEVTFHLLQTSKWSHRSNMATAIYKLCDHFEVRNKLKVTSFASSSKCRLSRKLCEWKLYWRSLYVPQWMDWN